MRLRVGGVQLEQEIAREALTIAANLFIQPAGGDAVEVGQHRVQVRRLRAQIRAPLLLRLRPVATGGMRLD
jgi:hypothetical protein